MNFFNVMSLSIALCLGISFSTYAKPLAIESYGDSLTTGFLSGTQVTDPPPLKIVSDMISDMVMFKVTQDKRFLEDLHSYELAWPNLIAQKRIREGLSVTFKNRAVSGSKSSDLFDQIKNVTYEGFDTRAFFLIGHNDLCKNTKEPKTIAKEFIEQYDKALAYWDKQHKDSHAYILPVGKMELVFGLLMDYAWFEGPNGDYTCNDSWEKVFPYCPSYYHLAKQGLLKDFLIPRIEAMNEALRNLIEDWNLRSVNGNWFYWVEHSSYVGLDEDHFAVDCYHLSGKGQHHLAESVYSEIQWD